MSSIKKDFIVRRTITYVEGRPVVTTYSEEELTRCKDCEHGESNDLGEVICQLRVGPDAFRPENWFCADGIRRISE